MQFIPVMGQQGLLTVKIKTSTDTEFFLHSKYNPWIEAERWIKSQIGEQKHNCYLVVGLGLGYHIEVLAKLRPQANIIILEGQSLFLNLISQRHDWQLPINGKIETAFDLKNYSRKLNKLLTSCENQNGMVLIHRPSILALPEQWQDLKNSLEDYLMRLDTIRRFTEKAINNWLLNRKSALKSMGLKDLKKIWQDKPTLIVGSGPSLLTGIEHLKKWRSKINLIAAGSAVDVLLKNDIKPDLQVFLDPQEKVSGQITVQSEGLPSLVFVTVHPDVVKKLTGPIYWAWQDGFDWKGDGKEPFLITGGSVITAAFSAAAYLGRQPVLFLGVDLAYLEGKSHVPGTIYGEIKAKMYAMRQIKSNDGNILITSRNLDYYRKRIEDMIEILNLPVYNLGCGAEIKGARSIKWDQIEGILC